MEDDVDGSFDEKEEASGSMDSKGQMVQVARRVTKEARPEAATAAAEGAEAHPIAHVFHPQEAVGARDAAERAAEQALAQ